MARDRKPWVASIEVRPDVGAEATAALTHKPRLDVGQPHFVGPAVSIHGNVAAAVAANQYTAQSHAAHLAEGDLHRPAVCVCRRVAFVARHAAIKAAI